MKNIILIITSFLLSVNISSAQVDGFINKAKKMVSNKNQVNLSQAEIIEGLKEALSVGAEKSVTHLSALDGYFKNEAIKILMPDEAREAEKTLRRMGLNKQVDEAILSMNRAAEDAAKSAAPIFLDAIKSISIEDGIGILKGNDTAATAYLRSKTINHLTEAFKPVIEKSLEKVDATRYWNSVFSTYNKVPFVDKVNPDLRSYVTERALKGLFIQIAQEEAKIRKDPAARVSDILRKVFGS